MSKRNKVNKQSQAMPVSHSTSSHSFEAEYAMIKNDLARVIVLNVFYLAIILTIYYTNNQTHYLEKFFERLFHI